MQRSVAMSLDVIMSVSRPNEFSFFKVRPLSSRVFILKNEQILLYQV